jgi:hypothetical protein
MSEKWIQNIGMKKGALHKELHIPEDKKIPKKKLEKASHASGKEGQRARLAMTLEGMHRHKEHKDGYHEKHHKR